MRKSLSWILALCAALVLALAMLGCGGSDSSTATLSKAEFIKKADAACRKGEEQLQEDLLAYEKELDNPQAPTESDFSKLDTIYVPHIEAEVEQIRALGVPAGDEDQVEAILDARQEGIEIAEEDPELLVVNDGKAVVGKSNELAKEFGFQVCGSL